MVAGEPDEPDTGDEPDPGNDRSSPPEPDDTAGPDTAEPDPAEPDPARGAMPAGWHRWR